MSETADRVAWLLPDQRIESMKKSWSWRRQVPWPTVARPGMEPAPDLRNSDLRLPQAALRKMCVYSFSRP
jgi:hypothetical protein